MLPVEQPFKTYTGLDGKPLDNGYVYFGLPNQDPITHPITVYWDAAGTIPAAQPLRTVNGYIMSGGTPANVFFDGAYSETVLDSKHRQVFYARTSVDFSIASVVQSFIASLWGSTGATLIRYALDAFGAVTRTLQDKAREFPTLKDFGATGDGITDDTAAVQRAINYGGYISAKAGVYLVSTLDFKGKSVMLIGDGEDKTIFKAKSAGIMFDVQEVADQALLPLVFRYIKLDGAGKATGGIYTRYRHKTDFSNVTVVNTLGDGLNEVDSWNNRRNDLTLNNNVNGLVLQGANNNAQYNGISTSGNSQYQQKIMDGGTVAGGSTSLSFNQCDVEFSAGYGIYVKTRGVVRYNDCYIGEQIQGKVFDIAGGMVVMNGGFAYFGTMAISYLGYLTGGKLYFRNVSITGAAFATVSNMFYSNGIGKAVVEDSPCYLTISGLQVMTGDVLDYGRTYRTFAPTLGRQLGSFTLNGTNSVTTTVNAITATCTTVTGAPCIMELNAAVDNNWLRNQQGCLVVVYSSQKDLTARLTNGSVGNTPDIDIGTLPATGGAVKTAVLFNWTYFSNDGGTQNMTTLELFQLNTVVGDSITVYEVFLSDFRQGKLDPTATFYNLGKA